MVKVFLRAPYVGESTDVWAPNKFIWVFFKINQVKNKVKLMIICQFKHG